MEKHQIWMMVEAWQGAGVRYLASVRVESYIGLSYYYAEVIGIDDGDKYETGFTTYKEALDFIYKIKRELEDNNHYGQRDEVTAGSSREDNGAGGHDVRGDESVGENAKVD